MKAKLLHVDLLPLTYPGEAKKLLIYE